MKTFFSGSGKRPELLFGSEGFDRFEYVSFDVFDTSVTRNYLQPTDLFHDLEAILSRRNLVVDSFARNRIRAEFELRKQNNFSSEVTLDSIYERLAIDLRIDHELAGVLKQEELSLESRSIHSNPDLKGLISKARDSGKVILFVSDTYLPQLFIKQLLESFGLMREGDYLFVSSDVKKMKSSGELFPHILSTLNILSSQICHVGDNEESDGVMPRRCGIATWIYKKVFESRYEEVAKSDAVVQISKFASISKLARLDNCFGTRSHEGVIWDVTTSVSAPLIFSFVNWCIQSAIKQGIKRLYFLSRDGQVLHRLACRIVEAIYPGKVQPSYLYVSRQSLLFPTLVGIDAESIEWIMAPTSLLTPRIVLRRINFQPEELSPFLRKYDFHNAIDVHLSESQRGKFRQLLGEAEALILQRVREYRESALGYLSQEGIFDDKGSFCIVDVGWRGSLQRALSKLSGLGGSHKPIVGYYFGLFGPRKHQESDEMHAWFTSQVKPRKLASRVYIVPMTELFTAADHGGVVSYSREHELYHPVLKSRENSSALDWGVEIQQAAMLKYCEHALRMDKEVLEPLPEKCLSHMEENYEKFLLHPTFDEARAYGSYMDSEEQNESYAFPLAASYSNRELALVRLGNYRHHHNEWQQGALAISSRIPRILLGLG